MPHQEIEKMVEETERSFDRRAAASIQSKVDFDLGATSPSLQDDVASFSAHEVFPRRGTPVVLDQRGTSFKGGSV
jgi:hypothetical protein